MNLNKAIEILSDTAFNKSTTFNPDFYGAIKLGIEALKRELTKRQTMSLNESDIFPGEYLPITSLNSLTTSRK